MDRYIDAEKAFNSVDTSVINSQYAISIIKSAPTEDVAPVVHARWIEKTFTFECSACCGDSIDNYAYCPRCGAKMDEEVE